jgi:hypothetical protein
MVNGVVDGAVVEVDRRESESRVMAGNPLAVTCFIKKKLQNIFDRAVKFHSSCIKISTVGQKKQGHAPTRLLKSTELKSLDGWIEQTSSHVVWRVVGEHGTNEYALHSNLC